MRSDVMAAFWEAQKREPNRWERLREIFEKLSMVLEMPSMCLGNADDLLEQLEQRLNEAGQLFPEPDWLAFDATGPEGLEQYCANHMGGMLETLIQVVERLAEERAEERAAGVSGPGGKDGGRE
ncbi:conserved hypothetical protein [Solidesulfovibrio fructosivorans JJ]]|uniref:Uncharacterized protein n=1 Tax=Solidesulfovibrio fructosivorans JJ] TaxID=596151 RepID=E1JWU5_SOLFR|nr:hypothetical protein [Solidesulfovibrio fructosivorans]EFL51149.1 conserved hypothetical protein [Solidesulfovibrio fructosivorans JJ]]